MNSKEKILARLKSAEIGKPSAAPAIIPDKKIYSDNQDNPFPRSKQKQQDEEKCQGGVDSYSIFINLFKRHRAHKIHGGSPVDSGRIISMLYV